MTIKIEYPYVCENEDDFNFMVKKLNIESMDFNIPDTYPCAIIDYDFEFNINYKDIFHFTFLYPYEVRSILENSKFKNAI